ncbi:hypothetical protein [Bradyrhizobium sp. SZCCHNPS1003]|uniref:hypothetical protein n=1 Tax=Bradyrhizobium sp. SZCCHNPS1003 TaxID=3057330 RepID=UPI0028EA9BE6|nr:hypothetical protein [Bradyrhizobium sp. SZCCHNPS1003]
MMASGADMLNLVEVFDVMETDAVTGRAVWTGATGTRRALHRDGITIDPNAAAYCPGEWLNERGYLEAELARAHPSRWGV